MEQHSSQLIYSMLFLRHIPKQQKSKNLILVLVVSFKALQFSIHNYVVLGPHILKLLLRWVPSRTVWSWWGSLRGDQDFRYRCLYCAGRGVIGGSLVGSIRIVDLPCPQRGVLSTIGLCTADRGFQWPETTKLLLERTIVIENSYQRTRKKDEIVCGNE